MKYINKDLNYHDNIINICYIYIYNILYYVYIYIYIKIYI